MGIWAWGIEHRAESSVGLACESGFHCVSEEDLMQGASRLCMKHGVNPNCVSVRVRITISVN
jgi:hypothetical protein